MVGAGGEAGDAVYDYPVRLGFLPKGARDGYGFWEGRVMTWDFSSRGRGGIFEVFGWGKGNGEGEQGRWRSGRDFGGRGFAR